MNITSAGTEDRQRMLVVWETAVRATHGFLSEQAIVSLRELIKAHAFDAVDLFCYWEKGTICGFIGIADGKVEMLFVDPDYFGQGVGRQLMAFAISEYGVTSVDVNEQNPRAIGFYEHLGFRTIRRSELDGQGNPFPILHMQLSPGVAEE